MFTSYAPLIRILPDGLAKGTPVGSGLHLLKLRDERLALCASPPLLAELDNITASLRAHPKVLEVRWQIYANLEKWPGALDIANAIANMEPDWPSGWIYRASTLTELNRHQEAYERLCEAATRFPSDEIIFYDLACICCALKRLAEAKRWLGKDIDVGGSAVKPRARARH